jgi:hypothetical protein
MLPAVAILHHDASLIFPEPFTKIKCGRNVSHYVKMVALNMIMIHHTPMIADGICMSTNRKAM